MSEPVPPSHASPPSPEQPSANGRPDAPDVQGPYAQAFEAAWPRLQDALRDRALTPLRNTLQQAADIHCSLVDAAALAASANEPDALWQRVLAYRRAAHADVLTPLYEHLAKRSPSEPISVVFEEVLAAFQSPPERHQGKKKHPAGPQADVRVAEELTLLHDAAQQHAARPIAQVEQALTTWTHVTLEAEVGLDRAAFHEQSDLAIRAPEEPEQPPELSDVQPVAETGAQLQEAMHALQTALENAAGAALPPPDLDGAALRKAAQALDLEAQRAPRQQHARERKAEPATKIASQKEAWSRWHGEAAARLLLDAHLLELRDRLLSLHDGLLRRTAEATLYADVEAFETVQTHLTHAREAVADACAEALAGDNPQGLAQALRSQHKALTQHLRDGLKRLASPGTLSQALTSPGEPEMERLHEIVERLPEQVTVHPPPHWPPAPLLGTRGSYPALAPAPPRG
ncbi:MAG: hypothetical protein ACR2GR_02080 [Rhodothermales bacterium]